MTPPLVIPPYLKEAPLTGLIGMGGGATSRRFYTASSSDETYNIEKSLKFQKTESAYLSRNVDYVGNNKVWTYSCWAKLAHPTEDAHLIGSYYDTNNRDNFYLGGDNWFGYNMKNNGSWHVDKVTDMKLRDTTAWQHIVIVWDTRGSGAKSRARFYVNGKERTWSTTGFTVTDPAQWAGSIISLDDSIFYIGAGPNNDGSLQSSYWYGHQGDVHFIDGLALSPAAFGSFDSTNNWNPKSFSIPAPNNGRTWSSSTTNLTNPANAFDGDYGVGSTTASSGSSQVSITFSPALTNVVEFEHNSHNGGSHMWGFNGGALVEDGGGSADYGYWRKPPVGMKVPSTINSFQVRYGPADTNASIALAGIRVNGVVLIDGHTNSSTRNNPNGIKSWGASSTGDANATYPYGQAFNGNISTTWTNSLWLVGTTSTTGNWTETLTLSKSITVEDNITFYYLNDSNCAGSYWELNDGTQVLESSLRDSSSDINKYRLDYTGTVSTIKQHRVATSGSNNGHGIVAIEVDGHFLIDNSYDNSFHLKFNDTTHQNRLGWDSLNEGSILEPVKSGQSVSGYWDDPNKDYLVLAVPGTDLLDHSATIKGSGSNKTLTVTGEAVGTRTTTVSRLYGSSLYFDGSTDYIQTASSSSDFTMGTGDFTVECWVSKRANTHKGIWQISSTSGGFNSADYGDTLALGYQSGVWQIYGNDSPSYESAAYSITDNKWYHAAYVRSSGQSTLYINGEAVIGPHSDTFSYDGTYMIFGGYYNTSYLHNGSLNDVRVYKGVAKYTGQFVPPARNDFSATNLDNNFSAALEMKYFKFRSVYGSTGYSHTYSVEYSDDNSSWTEAWNGDASTAGGGCMLVQGTGGGGSYGTHRYWRFKCGSTNNAGGHFPRVSRLVLTDASGVDHDIARFSSDNCADSGTIPSNGDTYSIDLTGGGDTSVDSPTNYLPTDGNDSLGGVTRGNYCTLNALSEALNGFGVTLSQGNLHCTRSGGSNRYLDTTWSISSGKWYYEATVGSSISNYPRIGIWNRSGSENASNYPGQSTSGRGRGWGANGLVYSGAGDSDGGLATFTTNDTLMFALDMDNGKIWFGKNGTWYTTGTTTTTAAAIAANTATARFSDLKTESTGTSWTPICHMNSGDSWTWNFGQTPYKYGSVVPDGFKTLCTQNLSNLWDGEDYQNNPSKFFDALLYKGTGSDGNSVDGLAFQPEAVWIKDRGDGNHHRAYDAIRGVNSAWAISHTDAPEQYAGYGQFESFDSGGFTVGAGTGNAEGTNDTTNHVAYCWDAGTSAATPKSGGSGQTITASNSWVNADAGFEILKYSTGGTAGNVGHNLGAIPKFIIIKALGAGLINGPVYHDAMLVNQGGGSDDQYMAINANFDIAVDAGNMWNNNKPTTEYFGVGTHNMVGSSSYDPYIAWVWSEVKGYSAFGKAIGTGDTDGPFCHCGFRPRFIIWKGGSVDSDWGIVDTSRTPYNSCDDLIWSSSSQAEDTTNTNWARDILANGFKIRGSHAAVNGSGSTFLWAAFAENPFKTARAF